MKMRPGGGSVPCDMHQLCSSGSILEPYSLTRAARSKKPGFCAVKCIEHGDASRHLLPKVDVRGGDIAIINGLIGQCSDSAPMGLRFNRHDAHSTEGLWESSDPASFFQWFRDIEPASVLVKRVAYQTPYASGLLETTAVPAVNCEPRGNDLLKRKQNPHRQR